MLTMASVSGGVAEFGGAVQDRDLVVVFEDAVAEGFEDLADTLHAERSSSAARRAPMLAAP